MNFFSNTILFLIVFITNAFALDVGLFAKRDAFDPINRFQIFAERCSGSNYVEGLLKKNFDFSGASNPYGWKHGTIWYSLPRSFYNLPSDSMYDFNDSQDCLIVVVFRNPYDWVRSLYLKGHHVSNKIKKLPFEKFIAVKWKDEEDFHHRNLMRINPLLYKNPDTSDFFKNIFELRTYKIKNMLMINQIASNVYYVNYEKVVKNPKKFIDEIARIYGLKAKVPFSNITYHNNEPKEGVYKEEKYFKLSKANRNFIDSQLSKILERRIGYENRHSY